MVKQQKIGRKLIVLEVPDRKYLEQEGGRKCTSRIIKGKFTERTVPELYVTCACGWLLTSCISWATRCFLVRTKVTAVSSETECCVSFAEKSEQEDNSV